MEYTYRFLEEDDFPQLIDLHKSKNTFMNQPLTEAEKRVYIDRITWLFFQPDYKVAGCFLDDKLVAVSGCRYFKNKMAAYTHGQCFNLSYKDFNYATLFAEVLFNITTLITDYAESLGIYQVYMARELSEGLAFYRYYKRFVKNKYNSLFVEPRYIYMLDKIYKKGDIGILTPHEFFFRPDNVVVRDTVISFLILRPEVRENILRINQQP